MSDRRTARDQHFEKPRVDQPRTLLEVREKLRNSTRLTQTQRYNLVSALNSLGKPYMLPGEREVERALMRMGVGPYEVAAYLDPKNGARQGLVGQSWTNVKTRVLAALEATGADHSRRPRHCLSADWAEKIGLLPNNRQLALKGVASQCTWEGVAAEQVTDDVFRRYHKRLEHSKPPKRARDAYLAAKHAYNLLADLCCPPLTKVVVDYKPTDNYMLADEEFASELLAEIGAWRHARLHPDPLDEFALPAVAHISADSQARQLLRLASALVAETDQDPKSIISIAQLVDVSNAKAALRYILRRAKRRAPKCETTVQAFHSAYLLSTVARRWVRVPQEHQEQLGAIARKLEPKRRGMAPKNRAMLNQFLDPMLLARFLALPEVLFARLLRKQSLHRNDAVKLSLAFAIAMLCIAPVRPRTAVNTQRRRNLIEGSDGVHRVVRLHYAAEEVKNKTELEFQISGVTLKLFDLYVERALPLLAEPLNPYLFPGRGDSHKTEVMFSRQIAALLEREIGVRVTAQQFRHLIGFVYLLENPGNYEVVRQFLGHKSISTTIRFYAEMEMKVAAKTLDETVSRRREELAILARRPKRKRRT
jgi:integrase